MSKYALLGAGGIGHYLLEPICRFLAYNREPGADIDTFYIIDGDIVESKNVARQHDLASVGKNKAEAMAERARNIVGADLDIQPIGAYFTEEKKGLECHKAWLENGVTIFVCVDNDKTRVLVEKTICELDSGVMVVGGNGFEDGQAQIFIRHNKRNMTSKISELAPEILEEDPSDLFPDDTDCLQMAVSRPQLVFANLSVANAMLTLWYSWKTQKVPKVNEILVNVGTASARHANRVISSAPILT